MTGQNAAVAAATVAAAAAAVTAAATAVATAAVGLWVGGSTGEKKQDFRKTRKIFKKNMEANDENQ